jgi:transmembrane sensor
MSNPELQNLPQDSAKDIHARAVEWLLERRDNENWSVEDQARLDGWLAQSPAHLLAYWRAEDGWKRTELLASVRPLKREPVVRNIAWPKLAQIAAAAVLVAIAGIAGYLRIPHEQRFSTPIGGYEAVALSDGSRIELNTNTVLRTRMDGNQRTITLDKGEAFFTVKHDAAHPFVVMVGEHRITDLGTKFTVRRETGGMEVTLLEGRVRLGKIGGKSQLALLQPGDKAVATADSLFVTKRPARELETDLSWRRGVLVFHHTALAEAAAELNRYNRTKIIIGDPESARLTMTGAFPANDITAFAVTAREVFGLSVDNRGDEIVITRARN